MLFCIGLYQRRENNRSMKIIFRKRRNRKKPRGGLGSIRRVAAFQTIAVVGSQKRIGTTTQALQVAMYLQMLGYSSAYVEMNTNGYIELLTKLYVEVKQDRKVGKITYQGLDLYSKEQIEGLNRSEYTFLVKDYGTWGEEGFEELSFLEQDIRICICGSKPNEIYLAQEVIEKNYNRDIRYIFSYTPKTEQKNILQLMDEKREKTGFADYVPDPFSYTAHTNQMYRNVLGV